MWSPTANGRASQQHRAGEDVAEHLLGGDAQHDAGQRPTDEEVVDRHRDEAERPEKDDDVAGDRGDESEGPSRATGASSPRGRHRANGRGGVSSRSPPRRRPRSPSRCTTRGSTRTAWTLPKSEPMTRAGDGDRPVESGHQGRGARAGPGSRRRGRDGRRSTSRRVFSAITSLLGGLRPSPATRAAVAVADHDNGVLHPEGSVARRYLGSGRPRHARLEGARVDRRPTGAHRGSGPLRLVDRPVPEPGPGEILVAVRACGVCRTDLHLAVGELPPRRHGVVPGHEVVGTVVGRGPGRVAVRPRRARRDRLAAGDGRDVRVLPAGRGEPLPGAVVHRLGRRRRLRRVRDRRRALRLRASPTGLPDVEAAPLLCAGIIGFRALRDGPPSRRAAASASTASVLRRTSPPRWRSPSGPMVGGPVQAVQQSEIPLKHGPLVLPPALDQPIYCIRFYYGKPPTGQAGAPLAGTVTSP